MEQDRLAQIRLVVMDVDGVLTDGTLYFMKDGSSIKAFNAYDGAGIVHLHNSGIQTAIISGRESPEINVRAGELGIQYIYTGIDSKLPVFETILDKTDIKHEEAAYIGDDLADIPPMRASGVSFAPPNSVPEVQETADIVLTRRGGQGAVREAAEMILKASGKWDSVLKDYL
ncbi:KdsC family phosphatase [Planctomycetota bacterium]